MSYVPDQTPEETREQELSLRSLSEAFAEALARQRASEKPPQDQPGPDEEDAHEREARTDEAVPSCVDERAGQPPAAEGSKSEDDDGCPISPRTILEAMLFVGDSANRPLESTQAASLMRDVEPEDVAALVDELNDSYRTKGCPYRIANEGSGFHLVLDEAFHRVREKFYGRIREARLSQAAIDVLAIVAYRQPLAADEVSRLRDKPSHHILCQLVRRRLLRVERPSENPRKLLYCTTDRFLELFELESLADLPQSEAFDRN